MHGTCPLLRHSLLRCKKSRVLHMIPIPRLICMRRWLSFMGDLLMTNRETMSDEVRAAYKRAAEAVIAAGTEDRGAVNEQIKSVIQDARNAWPDMTDEHLSSFFQSQSWLMSTFA